MKTRMGIFLQIRQNTMVHLEGYRAVRDTEMEFSIPFQNQMATQYPTPNSIF
jgi:hypothetical protein